MLQSYTISTYIYDYKKGVVTYFTLIRKRFKFVSRFKKTLFNILTYVPPPTSVMFNRDMKTNAIGSQAL